MLCHRTPSACHFIDMVNRKSCFQAHHRSPVRHYPPENLSAWFLKIDLQAKARAQAKGAAMASRRES
jgi:hypothetical protein